jgi:ketosteroid isomerase-like protein
MRQSFDVDHVRQWIDGYLAAWADNDPDAVKALFTPDARYRFRPYDEPKTGHDEIVAEWLGRKDEPGTWEARLQPMLIHDDTAIVTGSVDYSDGDLFSNLWVIRFADDGRAAEFTEWWMERPAEPSS